MQCPAQLVLLATPTTRRQRWLMGWFGIRGIGSLYYLAYAINQDGVVRNALELLAYPDVDWARLAALWPEMATIPSSIVEQLSIDARYEGYLSRQRQDIAAYRRDEALDLPPDLDYAAVGSLSNEVRQKLEAHKPTSLGQAARISGVTPAALIALLKYVRRRAA